LHKKIELHEKENAVRTRLVLVAATWAAVLGIVVGSANAQSPTPTGERFVLSGVVFVEGGRGLAWLQEPSLTQDQVVTLRQGDSIGPYRLTKILEDQVELEGPVGKFSVPLSGASATAAKSQEPHPQAPPPSAVTVSASVPGPSVPVPEEMHNKPEILPPHPALNNPNAIVIPRDDPRRKFPGFPF